MNKYEKAINEIAETYDAFYIENKYGNGGGTHQKYFETLKDLIPYGDKVENALDWIMNEYDSYDQDIFDTESGPFEYLRRIVRDNKI